ITTPTMDILLLEVPSIILFKQNEFNVIDLTDNTIPQNIDGAKIVLLSFQGDPDIPYEEKDLYSTYIDPNYENKVNKYNNEEKDNENNQNIIHNKHNLEDEKNKLEKSGNKRLRSKDNDILNDSEPLNKRQKF